MLPIVMLEVLAKALFLHSNCTAPGDAPPPHVLLVPATSAKLPLVAPLFMKPELWPAVQFCAVLLKQTGETPLAYAVPPTQQTVSTMVLVLLLFVHAPDLEVP